MASWSRQRRSIYAAVVIVLAVGGIGVPAFLHFYHAPSCFDGIQDGNEQGIDCGGSCQKLCPSSYLSPIVAWARFENVAPGLYNVAAYIINPNTDAEATDTPYHMALYDNQGMLITDVYGTMILPSHRNTLAFQPAVNVGQRVPARALFEFTAQPNWVAAEDTLAPLQITNKAYSENAAGSSLSVSLENTSASSFLGPLIVSAILYDASGNEIGFSQTQVDQIAPGATVLAPFTWPLKRGNSVVSIEVLPVAE